VKLVNFRGFLGTIAVNAKSKVKLCISRSFWGPSSTERIARKKTLESVYCMVELAQKASGEFSVHPETQTGDIE
jgi:hypothetical protein